MKRELSAGGIRPNGAYSSLRNRRLPEKKLIFFRRLRMYKKDVRDGCVPYREIREQEEAAETS
jgi:hypothetical protein